MIKEFKGWLAALLLRWSQGLDGSVLAEVCEGYLNAQKPTALRTLAEKKDGEVFVRWDTIRVEEKYVDRSNLTKLKFDFEITDRDVEDMRERMYSHPEAETRIEDYAKHLLMDKLASAVRHDVTLRECIEVRHDKDHPTYRDYYRIVLPFWVEGKEHPYTKAVAFDSEELNPRIMRKPKGFL